EKEAAYNWALTHVLRLFDEIEKPAVIVTDRELALMKALKTEDEWQDFLARWNDIIRSNTEDEFDEKWRNLDTMERKIRESLANALLHLGTTTTSRIEGSHATLKSYLQMSTEDLHHVHTKISLAVTNQRKEFDAMIMSEHIRVPVFATNNSFYANIKAKVSSFTLKKINKQYQKAKHATAQEPLLPCTGTFSKTLGLPCAHFIQHLGDQSLILNEIHKHWWIPGSLLAPQINENSSYQEDPLQLLLQDLQQKYQEWPEFQQLTTRDALKNIIDKPVMTLQNPKIVRTKGHPSGALNKRQANSTRRDPFSFELVDNK
ncbi:23331_t:CDS:2, partial [Cetraspora pellucida]